MAHTLQCDIVTPESKFYSAIATFVAVPASDGEMGVMSLHAPMVSTLSSGEVRVQAEGSEDMEHFAVSGGYVRVNGEKTIILADRAARVSEIDAAVVEERVADLERRIAALDEGDSKGAYLRSELAWNKLLVHLASR